MLVQATERLAHRLRAVKAQRPFLRIECVLRGGSGAKVFVRID
jgi:hypothetical protein